MKDTRAPRTERDANQLGLALALMHGLALAWGDVIPLEGTSVYVSDDGEISLGLDGKQVVIKVWVSA